MGRRKIEIKAIKDDRNRSVTFLKRKGGLFKKAHELSVLCSVDVAVFIFGNNKKLYEYSSSDMNELMSRHRLHGGISEHKGPLDFSGQNEDDDEEDADGVLPRPTECIESEKLTPQLHGQSAPFSKILRHNNSSTSPPTSHEGALLHGLTGGSHFVRTVTPQPPMVSQTRSKDELQPPGSSLPPQSVGVDGTHIAHPGITYMPTPPIYNHPSNTTRSFEAQTNSFTNAHPTYMSDRRPSAPASSTHLASCDNLAVAARPAPSPMLAAHTQLLSQRPSFRSPSPHFTAEHRSADISTPPPAKFRSNSYDRPQAPPLNTGGAIRKISQRKSHSIFTPVEENRSILSQHLASFAAEPPSAEKEIGLPFSGLPSHRSRSVGALNMQNETDGPSHLKRSSTESSRGTQQRMFVSPGPDSSSAQVNQLGNVPMGGSTGCSRPRGPRLKVQIPDEASEPGNAAARASKSPQTATGTPTQTLPRQNSHSSIVLPPPSPSASALLSAGATGPPNPFARPPPHANVNGETPITALPSRFLNHELLPSPSSFYPEWNLRSSDTNTLPSPLNFVTPVVTSGPSFLRDEQHAAVSSIMNSQPHISSAAEEAKPSTGASLDLIDSNNSNRGKRKSLCEEAELKDEAKAAMSYPKRLRA